LSCYEKKILFFFSYSLTDQLYSTAMFTKQISEFSKWKGIISNINFRKCSFVE